MTVHYAPKNGGLRYIFLYTLPERCWRHWRRRDRRKMRHPDASRRNSKNVSHVLAFMVVTCRLGVRYSKEKFSKEKNEGLHKDPTHYLIINPN